MRPQRLLAHAKRLQSESGQLRTRYKTETVSLKGHIRDLELALANAILCKTPGYCESCKKAISHALMYSENNTIRNLAIERITVNT